MGKWIGWQRDSTRTKLHVEILMCGQKWVYKLLWISASVKEIICHIMVFFNNYGIYEVLQS